MTAPAAPPPPPDERAKPSRRRAKGAPSPKAKPSTGPRRSKGKAAPGKENRKADVKRLIEIERELERLRQEKLALAVKPVRERRFPLDPLRVSGGGIEQLRGSSYSTWFKAAGSLGGGKGWDSYERMQHLLDENDAEIDAPAAFYSAHITGQVKFKGVFPLGQLVEQLNFVAPWGGDFRDIYPRWTIEYRVIESIGGVPVRIWAAYYDNNNQSKSKRVR